MTKVNNLLIRDFLIKKLLFKRMILIFMKKISLPKGQYAFSVTGMGMSNMDGSVTHFDFAFD